MSQCKVKKITKLNNDLNASAREKEEKSSLQRNSRSETESAVELTTIEGGWLDLRLVEWLAVEGEGSGVGRVKSNKGRR